jgi:hypothetical protein
MGGEVVRGTFGGRTYVGGAGFVVDTDFGFVVLIANSL